MMTSKELLREFYYRCEHLCETDEQLAILNSAYQQIRNELEVNEILMNKKVNIGYLKWLIDRKDTSFKENLANYNGCEEELTKIEFIRLTKWLKKGGQMTNEKRKK